MKQLTIACADDIEDRIIGILDRAGVEGFIRFGDATGNKFTAPSDPYRTMSWSASVLMVPGVPEEKVTALLDALRAYANSCTSEPCLRVIVNSCETVL